MLTIIKVSKAEDGRNFELIPKTILVASGRYLGIQVVYCCYTPRNYVYFTVVWW
jgi:hypothetical protein